LEYQLHFEEVKSALLDSSAECFAEVSKTCNATKAVCCMFSWPIHYKYFFFIINISARYMTKVVRKYRYIYLIKVREILA